jgi:putative PEP-CTERM system TPR-repeat lipoprotein
MFKSILVARLVSAVTCYRTILIVASKVGACCLLLSNALPAIAALPFSGSGSAEHRTLSHSNEEPVPLLVLANLLEPQDSRSIEKGTGETGEIAGLIRGKEYAKALQRASALVQREPGNPLAHNLKGSAQLALQQWQDARSSFQAVLKLSANDLYALQSLGRLDLLQGDSASARRRFEAVLTKDTKNVPALVGMAESEWLDKKEAEGFTWLDKAKAMDPQSIAISLSVARHYLSMKDPQKAIGELTQASNADTSNAELLDLLGQAQLSAGQKSAALETYRRLALLTPDVPESHYRLGVVRSLVNDLPGAANSLRTALKLRPDYVDAAYALAGIHIRLGRPEDALDVAKQLQRNAPQSPIGPTLEGDAYAAENRYDAAAVAYNKAFAMAPLSLIAIKVHAAESMAGRGKIADEKLRAWLTAHPDDTVAWQYSAGDLMRRGQYKLAIAQYQALLQKNPNDPLTLNNLATLYGLESDSRALEMAERAAKAAPDSAAVADTLGWILVQQGVLDRGRRLLEQAVSSEPSNTEIRYHLALALAKSGDNARAKRELERLLSIEPKIPQWKDAQALLQRL